MKFGTPIGGCPQHCLRGREGGRDGRGTCQRLKDHRDLSASWPPLLPTAPPLRHTARKTSPRPPPPPTGKVSLPLTQRKNGQANYREGEGGGGSPHAHLFRRLRPPRWIPPSLSRPPPPSHVFLSLFSESFSSVIFTSPRRGRTHAALSAVSLSLSLSSLPLRCLRKRATRDRTPPQSPSRGDDPPLSHPPPSLLRLPTATYGFILGSCTSSPPPAQCRRSNSCRAIPATIPQVGPFRERRPRPSLCGSQIRERSL